MNTDKMPQNAISMQSDRMTNQGMPNASFFSLAGLMAAAGRNFNPTNSFMGGPQGSFNPPNSLNMPNDISVSTINSPMTGTSSGASGTTVQTTSVSSVVSSSNTNVNESPSCSISQNSNGPGGSSIPQPQRSSFSTLLNNTDWSWVDTGHCPESINALMERGRSRNWTYEETLELISLYTSDEWQGKFGSEKKNHRVIWASLAAALTRRKDVSGDEARQRLNNLKALYNRIRRQLLGGEISSPQWEYWEPLHSFLGRPQPFLPLPPASPVPHFPPQHFQPFQGNFQNPNGMNRHTDGSPFNQFQNNFTTQNSSYNARSLFGPLGFTPPIHGFQGANPNIQKVFCCE